MAKFGELDWSEQLNKSADYVHIPTALWAADMHGGGKEGVDPLNKSEKLIKEGEVPEAQSNEEIAEYILRGMDSQSLGQWKDSEHLHKEVVTEEQAKELQKNWEESIQGFYDTANAPVNPDKEDTDWGTGKSFNSMISDKERLKRNMYTGD